MTTPADPAPRRLKYGGEAHDLTTEERRKGAETTNAKRRQQREDAEKMALEQLATLRLKAWLKLGALIDADSESVQAQAVKEILDRDLGKPGQSLELTGEDGAPLEVHVDHDFGNLVDKLERAGVLRRGSETAPDA